DEHAPAPIAQRHVVAPLPRRYREHPVREGAARHLAKEEIRIGGAQWLVEYGEPPQLLAVDRDQLGPTAAFVDHSIKARPALVVERRQLRRTEEQVDAVGDDAEPFELDAERLADRARGTVAAHEITRPHGVFRAGRVIGQLRGDAIVIVRERAEAGV